MQAVEKLIQPVKKLDKWHKEPWMLLVVGGPLIVVGAAIATGFIAWYGQDKVISNDYYRQGLHIDKELARDDKARMYNMRAELSLLDASNLQLQLQGAGKLPPIANVSISTTENGLRANEALYKIAFRKVRPGIYHAELPAPLQHSKQAWHVKLSGDDWRLTARWQHGAPSVLMQPQANEAIR